MLCRIKTFFIASIVPQFSERRKGSKFQAETLPNRFHDNSF